MCEMYEYELDKKAAIKRGEELYPGGFVLEEDRAQPFLHAGPMGLESWAQAATRWYIVPKKGARAACPRCSALNTAAVDPAG